VQNAEGTGGGGFHFERGLGRVFFEVEFLEFGMHDVSSQEADHEEAHEQKEIQALEGATAVKPFGDEMGEGDAGAPLLHDEVAVHEDLRGCAGVGFAKEASHVVGKESRRPGESEKDDSSHPDRGVQDSNYAEKSKHESEFRENSRCAKSQLGGVKGLRLGS